ncbi:MAG: Uncharacterised protein [Hyphomonas sp. TMED17]|nr:MAG: Uncharacterised protein [Hyphomonas sp. TMED17]
MLDRQRIVDVHISGKFRVPAEAIEINGPKTIQIAVEADKIFFIPLQARIVEPINAIDIDLNIGA